MQTLNLLTTSAAAKICGVSRQAILLAVQEGRIRAVAVRQGSGKKPVAYLISAAELELFSPQANVGAGRPRRKRKQRHRKPGESDAAFAARVARSPNFHRLKPKP